MGNNCVEFTGKENRTGLSEEDFVCLKIFQDGTGKKVGTKEWSKLAEKNARENACKRLFLNHQEEVVSMHRYGPDGTHPKNFGFSWSKDGESFEAASDRCYFCFRECALHYDRNSGKAFMAWVRGVFAKRAMDWVNDRNPDDLEREEIAVAIASTDVFRENDADATVEREENMMTEEAVEQIRNHVHKECESEISQFMDLWLNLGTSKKNPVASIGDAMGVTRQTSYNYKHVLQARVKAKFGNHFYGRD